MEHAALAPSPLLMLEQSGLGHALRGSLWLYPAVEVLHILGFALLVGAIVTFDIRLIRAGRGFVIEQWQRQVLPVAVLGFLVAAPMGFLLFTAEATAYVRNPVFLAKLALIVLALTNVAFAHLGPYRRAKLAGPGMAPSPGLRATALASLCLWIMVLVAGRLIAYV